ncbi:MAG: response regulator [Planctomycetaceae bacterium]|nr:response regulator [Planctomycetaceae bacterium]
MPILLAILALAIYGILVRSREVRELRRRIEESDRLRSRAESLAQVKAEFLANMSHEIRTPLNGILGMTELVLDTDLSAEQRDLLSSVQSSGEALLRIVNDILDLSKSEAGRLALDPVDFSLRELLSETFHPLAVRAQTKGLDFAYHVQTRIPDGLNGDTNRLRQVLINLVGNAIKFTETGEIVVRVGMESRSDNVVQVAFQVQDTGVGIPADQCERILEPFEQVSAPNSSSVAGTGLGLAISSEFIQLMGGELFVESEVGKGSLFRFTIPMTVSEAGKIRQRTQLGLIPDLPVLVISGSDTQADIVREMLVHWETAPTCVAGMSSAMASLDRAKSAGRPFGLIIIDANLTAESEFDICRQLRGNMRHRETPILMLTLPHRLADAVTALEAGASATLTKPVSQSRLARAIVKAIVGTDRQLPVTSELEAETHTLAPLQILLADDNETNRTFAVRLLSKQGHTVVTANDGRQAVALWKDNPDQFDLILMDLRMPHWDGLKATQEIRGHQSKTNRRLAIIAMTANTSEKDREQCRAVGMDGFVSKPIRSQLLFAEIRRVLETRSRSTDFEQQQLSQPKVDSPVHISFDKSALLESVDHDWEFLSETIEMFEQDSRSLLVQMETALQQQNLSELVERAHTMKGLAGNFRAEHVCDLASKLEALSPSNDLVPAETLLKELREACSKLQTDLKTLIAEAPFRGIPPQANDD